MALQGATTQVEARLIASIQKVVKEFQGFKQSSPWHTANLLANGAFRILTTSEDLLEPGLVSSRDLLPS